MTYNDLRKGRFSETGREYFITMVVQGRRNVFLDFSCARLLISELRNLEITFDINWLA